MSDQEQITTATATTPVLSVGDQLLLRPLVHEDWLALEPMLNDPATRKAFEWPPEASITAEEWIARQFALQKFNAVNTTWFTWAIVLLAPGTVIGWATLRSFSIVNVAELGAELEVCLNPAHRGRGYGPQALNEVIRWAFEDLVPTFMFAEGKWTGGRLGRVTALVMPHNTASIRMMRKTLLDDHGVVTVQRTDPSEPPIEARHFYLKLSQYMQDHSGHPRPVGLAD